VAAIPLGAARLARKEAPDEDERDRATPSLAVAPLVVADLRGGGVRVHGPF
jgi:hypothetical protein